MKKLIVALCSIVVLSVAVQAIEVKTIFDMPNLRACSSYDFMHNATGIGVESTLLRWKYQLVVIFSHDLSLQKEPRTIVSAGLFALFSRFYRYL